MHTENLLDRLRDNLNENRTAVLNSEHPQTAAERFADELVPKDDADAVACWRGNLRLGTPGGDFKLSAEMLKTLNVLDLVRVSIRGRLLKAAGDWVSAQEAAGVEQKPVDYIDYMEIIDRALDADREALLEADHGDRNAMVTAMVWRLIPRDTEAMVECLSRDLSLAWISTQATATMADMPTVRAGLLVWEEMCTRLEQHALKYVKHMVREENSATP